MINEDSFFVLSFALLFISVYLNVHENRRREERQDRRDDLNYERRLNEWREFGYKVVEDALNHRTFRRFLHKQ